MAKSKEKKSIIFSPKYKIYCSGTSDRSGGGVMITVVYHCDCELISPVNLHT